ncbi:MAG TPA: dynamin family protein [Candidatus Ozemobacteraceae bacterium]|nr:dynamin family protein [Candidatus Ozemobacteraceae bacterium]
MDLAGYKAFQERFLARLHEAGVIARELGFNAIVDAAAGLERRVRDERFSIAVLGEIKRGKSTLINALLGDDVLPRAALVCTAALCLIRYADKPEAVVHHRGGGCTTVDPRLLREWVTRKSPAAAGIDHVAIGWPLPLLRDGAVVIDTPGVNDTDEVRRRLTEEFIPRADGVLFVLNAGQPLSDSEMRFLTNGVLRHHIKKCWFVVNGLDRIADPTQREEALAYCREHLAKILPEARVWGVSAKPALEARRSGNGAAWRASGVAELLEGVSADLVENRRDALFDVPLSLLAAMLDDLEYGLRLIGADQARTEAQRTEEAARREAALHDLARDRDRLVGRFADAAESVIFEVAGTAGRASAVATPATPQPLPLFASTGQPPKPAGSAAARETDRRIREAVNAILSADASDEAKQAELRQLVRDQVAASAARLLDAIETAISPHADACLRDLTGLLARFDTRLTLHGATASIPPVEFGTGFAAGTGTLGVESRQWISGFGRLATLVFLLHGNILLAAAALGTSVATRLTADLSREVAARVSALIDEERAAMIRDLVARRAEIAGAWKRRLTTRFDQGLAVIRETYGAGRSPAAVPTGTIPVDTIMTYIDKLRDGVSELRGELAR